MPETVAVNKQLTLIGEGADVVTVWAASAGDHVCRVTADYVNIRGFTVTGATHYQSGIYLIDADQCNISDNTASDNHYYGISLLYSSYNTLTSNTVSNNDYSILLASSNNTPYHNNHTNNTYDNAYDYDINQWDSGFVGNYWSDYREKYPEAVEIGGNGIRNIPYDIPRGESADRFPLMHPWIGITLQKGDLDGDNQITPADSVIALAIAVGRCPCEPATLTAADVSGGGACNISRRAHYPAGGSRANRVISYPRFTASGHPS